MLNNATIMGRFTTDPEIRQTPSGVKVINFTLAVQRDVPDGTGNRPTDFIPCVAWAGRAEFIYRNFHKGDLAIMTGSMQSRSFTDRNGNNRNVVELLVANSYFSGERRNGSNASGYGNGNASGYSTPEYGGDQYDNGFTQQGFTPVESDSELPF